MEPAAVPSVTVQEHRIETWTNTSIETLTRTPDSTLLTSGASDSECPPQNLLGTTCPSRCPNPSSSTSTKQRIQWRTVPDADDDLDVASFEFLEKPEIDEILMWHEEFVEQNVTTRSPVSLHRQRQFEATSPNKVARELMDKFRRLNRKMQVFVLAGISILTMTIGYESWPFIAWAWPRLITFAEKFKLAASFTWAQQMAQSKAYRKLLVLWETGQPITPALLSSLGPEFRRLVSLKPIDLLKPATQRAPQ